MRKIKKWFLGSGHNIMRTSAVWNLIASMEYSLQSAILVLLVTRINGLYDAGVFTIAYTITQMMSTIGSYGMRTFQVSDVRSEYSFSTFFSSRVVSTAFMVVITIAYAALQGYTSTKMAVLASLCAYRVVDCIEDVFHGEMQKNTRLDVASKILAIRIFLATAVFGLAYGWTKDLFTAGMAMTVTAVVCSVVFNMCVRGEFQNISLKLSKRAVVKLLWVCLPVCLGGFLYNYLVNAPKYAIDRNLSEEIQTIFSILFMPIFVVNMLSMFIFKPMIVNMGIIWADGDKKRFVQVVLRQVFLITGLTIFIMVEGAVIGIDILGWIYGVELKQYRGVFTVLLAFGGIAALVSFFVAVLTIVRQQKYIIFSYGLAVVIDLLLIDRLVKKYEIWGAGMVYGIAMGVVMLFQIIVLVITIWRRKANMENGVNQQNIS